jgi:hypothetical protein
MLKMTIDYSRFKDLTEKQLVSVIRSANRRALNRSISPIRVLATRMAADKLGIKKKDSLRRIFINQATPQRERVSIKFSARPLPFAFFRAGSKSVSVPLKGGKRTVKRKAATALVFGQREIIPGGFLATMSNGHKAVLARIGKGQYPLYEKKTDQMVHFFGQSTSFNTISTDMTERFKREFGIAFGYLLARARKLNAAAIAERDGT